MRQPEFGALADQHDDYANEWRGAGLVILVSSLALGNTMGSISVMGGQIVIKEK